MRGSSTAVQRPSLVVQRNRRDQAACNLRTGADQDSFASGCQSRRTGVGLQTGRDCFWQLTALGDGRVRRVEDTESYIHFFSMLSENYILGSVVFSKANQSTIIGPSNISRSGI